MAALFKDIYNEKFFDGFTNTVQEIIPDFDKKSFLNDIYDNEWENRELKQRMRHISVMFKKHLSRDFKENVEIILRLIVQLEKNGFKPDSLEFIFFPDFIELYGLEDSAISIMAIEKITQFITCEFAVRPFLIKYPDLMIEQMKLWSIHKHPMVRRLASEGCRPRLPWAMALPSFKKDPAPIIPILENLKDDESESVRRSVANNLNDISKDNPGLVVDLVKKWQGGSAETDRLIKHACRTLLKQGNSVVMEIFGFGSILNIEITGFHIQTPLVKMGEYLDFTFKLVNRSNSAVKIRLEYGLYYQKANASLSRKVFQISERIYPDNSSTDIIRKQSFKLITTRKFHLGKHQLSIIVNGNEIAIADFKLTE